MCENLGVSESGYYKSLNSCKVLLILIRGVTGDGRGRMLALCSYLACLGARVIKQFAVGGWAYRGLFSRVSAQGIGGVRSSREAAGANAEPRRARWGTQCSLYMLT
jgi:hypothetical protein